MSPSLPPVFVPQIKFRQSKFKVNEVMLFTFSSRIRIKQNVGTWLVIYPANIYLFKVLFWCLLGVSHYQNK